MIVVNVATSALTCRETASAALSRPVPRQFAEPGELSAFSIAPATPCRWQVVTFLSNR
jgi:hypothetical protein